MTRILLVEDEPGLVRTLRDRLGAEGYAVEHAATGPEGLAMASGADLILLDVMLPGASGFDVCRDLRARGLTVPVLMLTARGQTTDKVVGLKLGADDYLTKPFAMPELLARIEALLRRHATAPEASGASVRIGATVLDPVRAEVTRDGQPVDLSAKEYRLLCYLAARRGELITRDEALTEVWGYDAMPTTRTVDVHIAGLRQKLEPTPRRPRYILTVHGLGYKLAAA